MPCPFGIGVHGFCETGLERFHPGKPVAQCLAAAPNRFGVPMSFRCMDDAPGARLLRPDMRKRSSPRPQAGQWPDVLLLSTLVLLGFPRTGDGP